MNLGQPATVTYVVRRRRALELGDQESQEAPKRPKKRPRDPKGTQETPEAPKRLERRPRDPRDSRDEPETTKNHQ